MSSPNQILLPKHYLPVQEVLETEQEEERLLTRDTVTRLQQALARAGQQGDTLALATLSWAATNTLLDLLLLLGACCRIR